MGWTYKHRKLRDLLRARYLSETEKDDWSDPAFHVWLKRQPEFEAG